MLRRTEGVAISESLQGAVVCHHEYGAGAGAPSLEIRLGRRLVGDALPLALPLVFQLDRIPPYVPGATMDPTYAPPEAVAGLALVAGAVVLPGSVIACVLAFRLRARMLRRTSAARVSA